LLPMWGIQRLWRLFLVFDHQNYEDIGVCIYVGEFDHDLTVLPHWKSWLIRGIIPKWPQDSG
jgi:hypothetical protein